MEVLIIFCSLVLTIASVAPSAHAALTQQPTPPPSRRRLQRRQRIAVIVLSLYPCVKGLILLTEANFWGAAVMLLGTWAQLICVALGGVLDRYVDTPLPQQR